MAHGLKAHPLGITLRSSRAMRYLEKQVLGYKRKCTSIVRGLNENMRED